MKVILLLIIFGFFKMEIEGKDLGIPSREKCKSGLIAHYYRDYELWKGMWPDTVSKPFDDPEKWTFTEYVYSRCEPLINHLFVRRGWFSVRWEGWIDTALYESEREGKVDVKGRINVSPAEFDISEFRIVTVDGKTFSRHDLLVLKSDISGKASMIEFRVKGNIDDNELYIDGAPYILIHNEIYKFFGAGIDFELYNTHRDWRGYPMGKWWIKFSGKEVVFLNSAISHFRDFNNRSSSINNNRDVFIFEILADDGCRLWIDGEKLIDDWRACWEQSKEARRRSSPVELDEGLHHIVVEYFQGQSLPENDADPMRLYWSCPSKGVPLQIITPVHFLHTSEQLFPSLKQSKNNKK